MGQAVRKVMFGRILTIIGIFALAIVAAPASAHAAQMESATHVTGMLKAGANSICTTGRLAEQCGLATDAFCQFACLGVSVVMRALASDENLTSCKAVFVRLNPKTLVGRAVGPSWHPPKLRLL